jgi:KaiC/GvpD/RAD55 family RecA-like ATPase
MTPSPSPTPAPTVGHLATSIGLPFLAIVAFFFVLVLVVVHLPERRRHTKPGAPARGGSGRVVGVVGRMGSGKSYFAVRMAYRRLRSGCRVVTNFSMRLPDELAANWSQFRGWDQFADLEDAIVIIDEAHLYAPSHLPLALPQVARWKLSQARKFGLDVYWISQHEDRVARILRDLTQYIYLCTAWFDHLIFTAKGFEPEKLRRKGKHGETMHLDRKVYFFRSSVANLYDTLQILEIDQYVDDGTINGRDRQATRSIRRPAVRMLDGSQVPPSVEQGGRDPAPRSGDGRSRSGPLVQRRRSV